MIQSKKIVSYLRGRKSSILVKIICMHIKIYLLTVFFLCKVSFAQQTESTSLGLECVAFYNLENLFDTIVDPDSNKILQEDFTPHGPKNFNSERYQHKLKNMAYAVSKIGKEVTPLGPSVIGVCEIENRRVLEDLVKQKAIADKNYKIVHHEGPDRRGIDCALLYDPLHFQVTSSKSVRLIIPNKDNFFTRDQLVVSGKMLGEKIHFIVIHWPSRRGGEAKSRSKRIEAAKLSKSIIDSLTVEDPNAKVILMGDFNDDPISPSIKDFLKAKMDANNVNSGELYNTMGMHYKKGIGTLAYRDQWNLFDQFIVTSSLLDQKKNYNDLTFYRSVIFNKPFLKNKKGNFKGYPFRTYVGSTFMGGYSDHFPVYLFLVKKV